MTLLEKATHHTILNIFKPIKQHRFYMPMLSALSAIFIWLSWPPNIGIPLIFVTFIPILLIEEHVSSGKYIRPFWTFFKNIYFTFFLWNLFTVWWVGAFAISGGAFTVLFNSFSLSLPLLMFFYTKKQLGATIGYLALICYWIAMEVLLLSWEFSFPWLNLGNGFACFIKWIQWYEYTGTFGGTFWVLVANIAIYHIVFKNSLKKKYLVFVFLWIALPIICSYYIYNNYQERGQEVEVVVVQPNIDPATDCFLDTGEVLSVSECVERLIDISETQITTDTEFLFWPESTLDLYFNEKKLDTYVVIDELLNFTKKHPQLSLITGIKIIRRYTKKETKTAHFRERYGYYDAFNSALFIDSNGMLELYHKSKLVPGAEILPYIYTIKIPKWLTGGRIDVLSSFMAENKSVVFSNKTGIGIAPAICYEAIYGEYMAKFVQNGASILSVITIDAWWGDTPGYKQIFNYTRLRAIECRRDVARSSGKGISGFINQRGDVLNTIQYHKQGALRHILKANKDITFYVKHGDYIGRWAVKLAFVMFILTVIKILYRRYSAAASKK